MDTAAQQHQQQQQQHNLVNTYNFTPSFPQQQQQQQQQQQYEHGVGSSSTNNIPGFASVQLAVFVEMNNDFYSYYNNNNNHSSGDNSSLDSSAEHQGTRPLLQQHQQQHNQHPYNPIITRPNVVSSSPSSLSSSSSSSAGTTRPSVPVHQVNTPRSRSRADAGSSSDFASFKRGFGIAISGLARNWRRNPGVREEYRQFFVRALLPVLLVMYSLVILLGVLLFPVLLILVLWAPGAIWQLFILIPLWSHFIARKISPMRNDRLFIEGLRPIDPDLTAELKFKMDRNEAASGGRIRRWRRAIADGIMESSHFALLSLGCLLLSIIPVVGSIAAACGEIYLVTNSLAWSLLEPYTVSCEDMSFAQRKRFHQDNRWVMFGFVLPFTVLLSIPFLGPLLMGFVQASVADLFYEELWSEAPSAWLKHHSSTDENNSVTMAAGGSPTTHYHSTTTTAATATATATAATTTTTPTTNNFLVSSNK